MFGPPQQLARGKKGQLDEPPLALFPFVQNCTSPPGMNYMICDGQRVPKPTNRVLKPDGGWREETRQGKCIVIKEKSASGEYKETRRCD